MDVIPRRLSTRPLPDGTHIGSPTDRYACAHPESPSSELTWGDKCPGCRVGLVRFAATNPTAVLTMIDDAGFTYVTALEAVRIELDAHDPLRVIFEREVARRG